MTSVITLNWKEFDVDLRKVGKYLNQILSSNYDGMLADGGSLNIIFFDAYSEEDFNMVNAYWDGLNENSFEPTESELIASEIEFFKKCGLDLVSKTTSSAIGNGILEAPNFLDILSYTLRVRTFLLNGLPKAAVAEIDRKILDGVPPELSPFVTEQSLLAHKNKILEFLDPQ